MPSNSESANADIADVALSCCCLQAPISASRERWTVGTGFGRGWAVNQLFNSEDMRWDFCCTWALCRSHFLATTSKTTSGDSARARLVPTCCCLGLALKGCRPERSKFASATGQRRSITPANSFQWQTTEQSMDSPKTSS